jgi:outer membrane protein assembly factor BamB
LRRPRPIPARVPRRSRASIAVLAVGVALVAAPVAALAQSTGAWTGFQGGPEHRGAVDGGPEPALTETWALPEPIGGVTETQGLSGVAYADGIAVTVAPEAVIAVDAATGEESWRVARDEGPSVDPAIAGSGAYAVVVYPEGYGPNPPSAPDASASPDGATSPTASPSASATASPSADADDEASGVSLVAVSLTTGEERWRVEVPSPVRSAVTASADAAFVAGLDGSVTAVDVVTGDVRWTQPVGSSIHVPVAIAGELVIASASGDDDAPFAVVALRADDGSQAWRFEPGTATVFGSAVSIADGVAFVVCDDATVRALDAETGAERWVGRMNDLGPGAPPVVAGDLVVVADVGGQVTAFDRATGERRWDHALNVGRPNVRSAPVATPTVVLVPTVRGELFAVELASGDLVSLTDVADGLLRSLAIAGDVVIGVRSGSEAGLVGIGHDPDGPVFRTPSPTTFDAATFAVNAAIAIVPIIAIVLVAGPALARRLGPAAVAPGSPRDPIEDDLDDGAPA